MVYFRRSWICASGLALAGSRLEIEEGTAALRVVRQYSAIDGRVLEVSVSDHPEDRHTFRLEFS